MIDTNTPAADAAPAKPAPQFTNLASRTKTIPLAHPLQFDGKIWDAITVRRVTGLEMMVYVEQISTGKPAHYPGIEAPVVVYEGLDADDMSNFNREIADFLPQSLRENASSPQASGQ